ncbi:MAG: hypothetical protein N3A61_02255, partial [Ignavibacteria bacterium]|nr:hypothetical protein [Ignavibacteria bacterium]
MRNHKITPHLSLRTPHLLSSEYGMWNYNFTPHSSLRTPHLKTLQVILLFLAVFIDAMDIAKISLASFI